MNGRVLDPSTKVISGADILVISDATGLKYSGKTNDDGIYVVPNLPPGRYRLQVSKVGFKTLIKPDIVLNIQGALAINFTLPVGAVFETVTVEGGTSMINTTDASVSTVVDHTYVENMPLNGRSFQDLILLTPGVVTQSPQNSGNSSVGGTGEFSVNGQRQESNYYTVDGVSANVGAAPGANMFLGQASSGALPAATALGTTQGLVSVDDLEEFRVQSSSYSAEYGRNPGGQFAFETKSGTNRWHGTAYDYLRNGFFDAPDWFNNYFGKKEPILRQNDFGGTFGGPVNIPGLYNGKDKTFFFVSYEGLHLEQPKAATVSFVPDVALRSSAPSPLNQVLNAFPIPNGPDDTANGIAQFIATWSTPASINSTSIRFDHSVSGKLRLFFRFSDTPSNSMSRGLFNLVLGNPAESQTTSFISRSYTAGANSIFTNRLSNQFRLNYSSNETTGRALIDSFGGSTPVDLAQLTGVGPSGQPGLFLLYGGYDVPITQTRVSAAQRQWNFVDTVDVSWGRHEIKFGVDYRRLTPFAIPANILNYLYLGKNSVQTNNALALAVARAPAYPLYMNFSAFIEDEWRASQRLSFSVGLRWEVNPAPGVTQGLKPYTVNGSGPNTWALAPQGTPLWQTSWYNFAPRLGVAYILHDARGRETVVRGGGGVFFDTGQQEGSLGFNGPGFLARSFQSAPFPTPVPTPVIVNPPVVPYDAVTTPIVFPSHLQLPYTLQWNTSVEQALGTSQVLTISFVGSHAVRLLRQPEISTPNNPNSGSFFVTESGLTADYEAVQAQLTRRVSKGLTALGSYTWSHCIDYGSQNYGFAAQRGNCDFDVRHNLSTAFSYDLPSIGSSSFQKIVLHNWGLDDRLSVRTSFPVTLIGVQDFDPRTGQLVNFGLDLVQDQPIYLYGATCTSVLQSLGDLALGQTCPGGRAVNPNAFGQPPTDPNTGIPLRLGNAPRNFVRGFAAWQMNLAIRRDFPIRERLKLQFRAEAFNVFNHPSFGTINSSFGQTTFGQATATLANSLPTLSPLYQMGGPRSMQFALKVVF